VGPGAGLISLPHPARSPPSPSRPERLMTEAPGDSGPGAAGDAPRLRSGAAPPGPDSPGSSPGSAGGRGGGGGPNAELYQSNTFMLRCFK
jgi:hypothetical protein